MWNETLIESRRSAGDKKKWLVFPVSLLFHSLFILLAVFASIYVVESNPPPMIPVTFVTAISPPPPPAAARPKGEATPTKVEPVEIAIAVQPAEIPDLAPSSPEVEVTEINGTLVPKERMIEGVEGGMEGGVEGGIAGGIPGGLLATLPTGLLGTIGVGEAEEAPLRLTAEMIRPRRIKIVKPDYPRAATKARIEGTVVLQAIINERGSVDNAEILRSLHPLLDHVALQAVRQWKYRPAMMQNRPVKVFLTVIVKFQMKSGR